MEAPQFLECLPLYEKAGATDREALAEKREEHRREHNLVTRELARAAEPFLEKTDARRNSNLAKFDAVGVTVSGDVRVTSDLSAVGRQMRAARASADRPAPKGDGVRHETESAQADYIASLKAAAKETP